MPLDRPADSVLSSGRLASSGFSNYVGASLPFLIDPVNVLRKHFQTAPQTGEPRRVMYKTEVLDDHPKKVSVDAFIH